MTVRRTEKLICMLAAAWMLAGCGDDDGSTAGSGGSGGTAGASAAGVGGSDAGSGGGDAGSGGSEAGSGGSDAGSGGSDAGGSADIPARPGCEDADTTAPDADLYAAALEVLTGNVPCGLSNCHGNNPGGGLRMVDMTDMHETLVGQPACQAPAMMLVDDSGGDEGLAKSYLWQKMGAASTAQLALIPQESWGESAAGCGQQPGHDFGQRMPLGQGQNVSQSFINPIRNWICAGAPAP